MTVYVLGIPESGGMWLSQGVFYTDYAKADKILEERRNKGEPYLQLFTLYKVNS